MCVKLGFRVLGLVCWGNGDVVRLLRLLGAMVRVLGFGCNVIKVVGCYG